MINKNVYRNFLNQNLSSYKFKNEFSQHNNEFKMNLSNSGLSLDSINIELKEYEFSIQQLKTFKIN